MKSPPRSACKLETRPPGRGSATSGTGSPGSGPGTSAGDAGRSVSIEQLAAEPFLLLDLPVSRDYFLSLFHREGLAPRIAGRFEHMEVIRSLAARGEGFGMANAQPRNRASLDGHRLAYLALQGNPRPLTLGIMMVKNTRRTQTVEAFFALCHELIRDQWLADSGRHGHAPAVG